MLVLAMLGGIWIAEFGGPYAIYECLDFAREHNESIVCVTWVPAQ